MRFRIRPLVLAYTLGVAALAVLVVSVARSQLARGRLEATLGAPAAAAVLDVLSELLLPAAIATLLLAGALGLLFAGLLNRPLARLRDAVNAHTRGESSVSAFRSAVVEVQALAQAIDRLAVDTEARLGAVTLERDELAMLVNFVSEGILQLGSDGRVVHANPAAQRLLGIPGDAPGQPLASLVRQADLRALLERAAAGSSLGSTEVALDDRRLLVSARPIPPAQAVNGAGEYAATVVALLDLTEVRRLEGVRRDFVANVSHELKTPLTSIRGYVETLLTDDLPHDMQRQFHEVIQNNANRIQSIVDDLLDLSRLESGGWRPEMQQTDALRLAEEVWESYSERAERKRIEFVPTGDHALVLADPGGLRQVLSNLYDNALRHTPDGGVITVRVTGDGAHRKLAARAGPNRSARVGTSILIEVRDSGTGIPSDALPRIFERFYRVDPARSRAEGGTGLGLSIVKHLMESMGGAVTAESELGKGTTIRLRLASP
jgi:two-component system phosphate regulon sensor histidine kinase PhoR